MDYAIAQWFVDHRDSVLTHVSALFMWLGSSTLGMAVVGCGILVLSLLIRTWRPLLASTASALVGGVAALVLKQVNARPRPGDGLSMVHATGYSMPSSAATICVAASVGFLYAARLPRPFAAPVTGAFLLAVVGVCWSVVYLGAHWFSDVVAGILLGLACGAVVVALFRRLWPSRPADSGRISP